MDQLLHEHIDEVSSQNDYFNLEHQLMFYVEARQKMC